MNEGHKFLTTEQRMANEGVFGPDKNTNKSPLLTTEQRMAKEGLFGSEAPVVLKTTEQRMAAAPLFEPNKNEEAIKKLKKQLEEIM